MPRGGRREKAGRKSAWNHSETDVIRVPRAFIPQLLEIARRFDNGEIIDFVTKSEDLTNGGESEKLEGEIKSVAAQLSLLDVDVPSGEETDTSVDVIPGDSEVVRLPGDALLEEKNIIPLGCRPLARRLNVGASTVIGWKDRLSRTELLERTRSKDPDGIGWEYSELDKKMHPVL